MTRLLLIIFLLLSSSTAYAEWIFVDRTADGQNTVYADPGTIRRKGDLVKMWHLYNYTTIKTVLNKSLLSMKVQSEFDCAEEQVRTLAGTWFSGQMGNGAVVNSVPTEGNEAKWEPVSPRSINEALWEFACSKK